MKVVGIIAEYNPFHNGHAYQIRKAKELSSADLCIVAMSGSYVQRGVPAVTDKYSQMCIRDRDLNPCTSILFKYISSPGFLLFSCCF